MENVRERLETATTIQQAGEMLLGWLLFAGPHADKANTLARMEELEKVRLIVNDPMFQDNALRCHCLRKMGLDRYAEAIEQNNFTLMLEHEED
jgi:hypothetical protein